MGGATSVNDGNRTACSTIGQLVVSVTIVLALSKATLFNTLVLKLCRILLNSKVLVEEVGDREAHSVRWCRRSKGGGEKGSKSEEGTSASLHGERLSVLDGKKRRNSAKTSSDGSSRIGAVFNLLYPEPPHSQCITNMVITTTVLFFALVHRLL